MAGNGNSGRKRSTRCEKRPKIPPLVELPDAPEDLGQHGLRHWSRVGPLLIHARVLTMANLPSLEMLCVVYERWCSHRAKVEEEGATMGGKKHPLLGVIQRDEMELMRLNAEFGMSPATASSRLTAPASEHEGEEDEGDDEEEIDDSLLFGRLRVVSE